MPLNEKAAVLFQLTAKEFIKKMTPQQLQQRSLDKKGLLMQLLIPIKDTIQSQQQKLSARYETLKNAEADEAAYRDKTEIEASAEFLIVHCDEDELLKRLDLILTPEQPENTSFDKHRMFTSSPKAIDTHSTPQPHP
jgi:hypothetical protein